MAWVSPRVWLGLGSFSKWYGICSPLMISFFVFFIKLKKKKKKKKKKNLTKYKNFS